MKSKALLVVVALSAALAFGLFASGCGGDSDPAAKSAPAASTTGDEANPPKSSPEIGAFRKVAFKACSDSTTNERVAADTAEAYCACAVDELVKKVNAEAMAQIGLSGVEDLPTNMEIDLTDAIVTCSDIANLADQ